MERSYDYEELHTRVREMMGCLPVEHFPGERIVFETLTEVEIIRSAVKELMCIAGAEFAADILCCIAAEARQVRLHRLPEGNFDPLVFDDCADDEYIYTFIRASLTRPNE